MAFTTKSHGGIRNAQTWFTTSPRRLAERSDPHPIRKVVITKRGGVELHRRTITLPAEKSWSRN